MEAAIQKYGGLQFCSGIAPSNEVPADTILGGLLVDPEFKEELEMVEQFPMLVLTDFGTQSLIEMYDAERLAYEVWRSGAMLRILGKGAPLRVDHSPTCCFDERSDQLDRLVTIYDNRNAHRLNRSYSAAGVVFASDLVGESFPGAVFLPTYNVGEVSPAYLKSLFLDMLHIDVQGGSPFNFVWLPYNLKDYLIAHHPLAQAFADCHGLQLDVLLTLISAICLRVWSSWNEAPGSVLRYWQRGYEGPYRWGEFFASLQPFVTVAAETLGVAGSSLDDTSMAAAFEFLTLGDPKRQEIDLTYPGPHYTVLPYGHERVFLDYAWLLRRLFNLFLGVSIPDQNFKGDALERIVRSERSALPVGPCKARGNQRRQIDAAFETGSGLVVVECRAFARSIGFERGNPEAITYRTARIEAALNSIDEKATWLAKNPVGTNYDISQYEKIVPIAVTPFVEFIPSLAQSYWLTDDLPRVLVPEELKAALHDGTFARTVWNSVPLPHPR